jgi:FkbM family methyltransferase
MAIRHSKLAAGLEAVMFRFLPAPIFIGIARVMYPLLNKKRRWPVMNIRHINNHLFCIEAGEERFFFYEHTRLERYLWPDPLHNIRDKMLDKYSYNEIAVSDGDVVVEIGANIGEFTRAAALKALILISVEPDPVAFNCLERNVSGLSNVTLFNGVVSEKNGNVDFYISSEGADSSIIEPDGYEKMITVESMTLDTLLDKMGISHVDFLKIEAEGGEPEVLRGARNTLLVTRKVAIDCGPERKGSSTRNAVHECLKENHFNVFEKGYMVYGIK